MASPRNILWLTRRQWIAGSLLFLISLGIMLASNVEFHSPSLYFPASGLALSILFLEGISLWPFIFLASLLGNAFGVYPLSFVVLMPIGQTLQAIIGAALLKRWGLDPIFRRSRDMFVLFAVVAITAFVVPTFASIANILHYSLSGVSFPLVNWGLRYMSTVFSLLIITPFVLRWCAKPRFNRNWIEMIEIIAIFFLLILICFLMFVYDILTIGGISLVYIVLIPLFWIALRLRPRFVTLAFVLMAAIGFVGLLNSGYSVNSKIFSDLLFQFEALLITLASGFFIVVSLEENRRINSNLMRSQLATMQNAVARVTSESNAKNDFIAVLAHELRNPLAPVMSGIEFLKLKNEEDEEEIETLVVMEDRMSTVKRLLDDLLDISRISEGKISIKREKIELDPVIRNAIVSTTHLVRERHQLLTYKDSDIPLVVYGDPVRLEQIFTNLLSNASRYTDSGGQITITLSLDGPFAKVEVRDTGIGIPAESMEHIFLPFHQVESGARAKKGLGIGLALVKNFVEMHGGSVQAESEGTDKGSTFTVLLPLATE